MIMVYVTCKDKKQAHLIARKLLDKRLIACANIFPIDSIYRWKGKLVSENEVALLAKSTRQKYKAIQSEVKKLHSYEIPCIEMISTKAINEYEKWVKMEVR
ncbi:MAG: divalent-cation tolerance protein CutA [Candidatus Woesearchaeota archaeon]